MAHPPLITTAPVERFFGYYPGTVAVVTSAHAGERNVLAVGWHSALSAEPPLYGVAIGPTRYSHRLITAGGHFGVHFLPFEHAAAIAGTGSTSAHDGVDKFAAFQLETKPGVVAPVPILQCAYLAYECRVTNVHPSGDHDWVVGEVVAIHHRADAYDERFLLKGEHVRPAVFYGRSIFEAFGNGERAQHLPPKART